MTLRVSGKNLDIGEALRQHVLEKVEATVARYFGGSVDGHVVMTREGSGYRADDYTDESAFRLKERKYLVIGLIPFTASTARLIRMHRLSDSESSVSILAEGSRATSIGLIVSFSSSTSQFRLVGIPLILFFVPKKANPDMTRGW